MQKLTFLFSTRFSQTGSALVGAIALSLVMALGSVGLMQVCGSLSRNESQVLEETKAFYAAESGLLIATRYARTLTQADFQAQNNTAVTIPLSINGYSVACVMNSAVNPQRLTITATTARAVPGAGFKKKVSWDAQSSFSQYAFLFGREHDDNSGINEAVYAGNIHNDWLGHIGAKIWHGPYHMNDKMKLGCYPTSKPSWSYFRFDGPVTIASGDFDAFNVANAPAYSHMNYTAKDIAAHSGYWPANANGYQNNFDNGLQLFDCDHGNITYTSVGTDNVQALLNSWFLDRFQANAPQVDLPQNIIAQVTASNTVTLTPSQAPTGYALGDGENDYRPTLEFVGGANPQVIYHYYNGTTYVDQALPNWNGDVLYSTTSVNVHGVVKGQVTVATAPGTSIAIVADGQNGSRGNSNLPGLVYDDYILQNDTFPAVSTGNNVIGLVTGKDIVYNAYWNKATLAQPLTKIKIQDALIKAPTNPNAYQKTVDKKLFLTAAQIATADPNGCARWDLSAATGSTGSYYGLFSFGSEVYNRYRQEANAGCGQIGATAYYDKRLANVSFPNQPCLFSVDPDNAGGRMINFTFSNWQQSNPL